MQAEPDYHDLAEQIAQAIELHYRHWIASHPQEQLYAYVLYTDPLMGSVEMTVLSEQGLEKIAYAYQESGDPASLEQLKQQLRWSVADSPYCGEQQDEFDVINNRLWKMQDYVNEIDDDDQAFDDYIDKMSHILASALNQTRKHVLNNSEELLLYVDFGDMGEEERVWFLEHCNGKEQIHWFKETGGLEQ